MEYKSKKFDNDHVRYRRPVAEQNITIARNTKSTSYNDLNGPQSVISCEDNAFYAADSNLGQDICRRKTLHEAASSSSQNDTKEVKPSLKDQTSTADDPYSESVKNDDSDTFKKVLYEDDNESLKYFEEICNGNRTDYIQVGNDNIMIISKQSESIACQQIGNKNIIIHLQVNSNQFKLADFDDRDSEGEVWLEIKKRIREGIGVRAEPNDLPKELKDYLSSSDSSKMIVSDYSSLSHKSDSLRIPSKYWEDDEEHYATIDVLEREDSLRIKFGKKGNRPSAFNIHNLAGSPIMSHKKVQDFLRDNGNDFDVTIKDWENDSDYDFIPSFSVDSDQWNKDWSKEQNNDAECQSSYLSEDQSQIPPVPKKRIARKGAFRPATKWCDGETKHRRGQALPHTSYGEVPPARFPSSEIELLNEFGPAPLPPMSSQISENDIQISLSSCCNVIENVAPGSNYPDDFYPSNNVPNGKKSTAAGSAAVTKKIKPKIAPKPKNPHEKGVCIPGPNRRKEDVTPNKNERNGKQPIEAGAVADTKKSKPKIPPKPKIRGASVNIEADTKKSKPKIPSKPKTRGASVNIEAGQQTNTVTIKPTPLLKPLPDQQDLPLDISPLSPEANSRNKHREKDVNDSKLTMKQDRESPIPVEESELVEEIKSQKLLDLIACYSNVKEFKSEEYMRDTDFESSIEEMPVGTFLVRPGKSTKNQVLVIKTSACRTHKFQIHEKQGLFYILEKDAFSSINEMVRYYSVMTLPSANFCNVLERGIYSR